MRTTRTSKRRQIARYPSAKGDREYTVMMDLESGRLTCNCPTWVYKLRGDRSCPHTYRAEKEIDVDQILLGRVV